MVYHGKARRISAAMLVSCAIYLALDTLFSLDVPYLEEEASSWRGLSEETLSVHESRGLIAYKECSATAMHKPEGAIVPVYAASYPGSGSQMTHYLYEAVTGLQASTEWSVRGDDHNAVTIKTHYPARAHQVEGAEEMDRAILHLRNPIHALPSYASFSFEVANGIPDHTVRAPKKFWEEWRDKSFDDEIKNWVKHLQYWVDNYDNQHEKRIIITYENLISELTGPNETQIIADFLDQGEGVTSIDDTTIPCVWDHVVNYEKNARKLLTEFLAEDNQWREENKDRARKMIETYSEEIDDKVMRKLHFDDPFHPGASHRSGPKVEYTFTTSQLQTMAKELQAVKDKYATVQSEGRLETILDGYISTVHDKIGQTAKSKDDTPERHS